MAENEYLDSSKSRRWHALARAICTGASDEELAERMLDCFCKTLRQMCREVPFSDLLESMRDPAEFDRVCKSFSGAATEKDFLRQAALEHSDQESAVRRFLEFGVDNCLSDIPWLAQRIDDGISISNARRRLSGAKSYLRPAIDRMAKKFAANPAWCPRRPNSRKNGITHVSPTQRLLGESLIAGHRK
jgi:hypothetical protein